MNELYDPKRHGSAPSNASLSYRGGPLLTAPKIVGVYVDDFPFAKEMSGFLDAFVAGDAMAELKEYNVSGSGTHLADVSISSTGPSPVPPPPPPPVPSPGPPPPPPPVQCPPGCVPAGTGHHKHKRRAKQGASRVMSLLRNKAAASTVSDAQLQALIAQNIKAGMLPEPDAETLYVLFLPEGMSVSMGSDGSCTTFCGYHDQFSLSGGSVYYAILPYPSCAGCLGGLSAFDALTGTTSHEISEAVTDPVPGQGWYDDQNGEIGDICAWQFRKSGQYNVQLEWSNQQHNCI